MFISLHLTPFAPSRVVGGGAWRRRLLAVALGAAITLVSPAPAAWGLARWKHHRITYRNYAGHAYHRAVEHAIDQINLLPVGLRLRRAPVGRSAEIVIRDSDYGDTGWAGETEQHQSPSRVIARMTRAQIRLNDYYVDHEGRSWPHLVNTASHELLHAVGLDHIDSPCAVMHPTGLDVSECSRGLPDGQVACGPQEAEFEILARLYGRLRVAFVPGSCAGHAGSASDEGDSG